MDWLVLRFGLVVVFVCGWFNWFWLAFCWWCMLLVFVCCCWGGFCAWWLCVWFGCVCDVLRIHCSDFCILLRGVVGGLVWRAGLLFGWFVVCVLV